MTKHEEMIDKKRYIGDGVYVTFDGLGIVLTTEDGVGTTNRIVLEPEVLGLFEEYVDDVWGERL